MYDQPTLITTVWVVQCPISIEAQQGGSWCVVNTTRQPIGIGGGWIPREGLKEAPVLCYHPFVLPDYIGKPTAYSVD